MPKVKEGCNYSKKYTEEDIIKAIAAVNNGMPKKTAALKFGVPRPTLQFRLCSKFIKSRPGPTTILTEEEEKTLVEWVISSSRKGFPKRKEDILLSVEQFLSRNPRPNNFVNNKPGDGWYRLFLKRHPELTHRTAEAVTSASANVSETNIRQWFQQIERYLKDNGYFDILSDASRVYNGDETNFQLCPKNTKVLAEKGCKNVYEVDHAQAKSCLTVMFSFSASGKTTPPMVIYPLKRMRADIRNSVPSHWGLGLSDNGWMNKNLFYQYIHNVLYPYLVENKIQFPIILFVDGHKSHMNYDLSESCKEKGIILIALYPNATRILQPADVSAFKPMKNAWKKSVLNWRRNNLTKTLTKIDFGPILSAALDNYIKPSSIVNGFKSCGLCPWNPNAIDFSKCLGKNCTSTTNLQLNSEHQTHTMTLKKFQEIVGPSILKNLRPDCVIKNPFQNALVKVYNYLKTESADIVDQEIEHIQKKSFLIDDSWVPIDDIPVILDESLEDLGNLKNVDIVSNSIENCSQDPDFPILMKNLSDDLTGIENIKGNESNSLQINNIDLNVNLSDSQHNFGEFELTADHENISYTNENTYVDQQLDFPKSSDESTISGQNVTSLPVSNNKIDFTPEKENLKSSLIWPKTPVRKGNKVTEKKPVFVLTSNKWLEIEKNKIDEKEKKENEKQERKRIREENKTKNKTSASNKKETAKRNTKIKTIKQNEESLEDDENRKSFTHAPKIIIESQVQFNKPDRHDNTAQHGNLDNITFPHTVTKIKDFMLPLPMKKVLQRRETFRNEIELSDFLHKNDNPDSDDNSDA
ncbi:uncharacterized protein LOC118281061 [Spodoptera frugiperda]|uniref:Uncharacterized protein LOC118281061 n=1 Tax=Spodoptera frugiperda TaxID=7108 RepID=A0A9R0DRY9_SPOFR|nr:uncharacterized protein LOC118281061 [Spodoptera frugiperda]